MNTNNKVSALEINAGTMTLTDVNIDSARHAVRIDGAVTATINGGTYRSAIGTGTGTYHAVNVSGDANVTIVDGTFVGPKGTTADSGAAVNVQAGAAGTIEGGSFSGGKNNTLAAKGTLTVSGGTYDQNPSAYCADGYMAVENAGLYMVSAVIAEVDGTGYADLQTALKANKENSVFDLLADVTVSDKWDCRYNGAKIAVPVTINGNGHTLTLTGEIDDKNWDTVFRFEADATVNDLTIDVSEATGVQRGISTKLGITMDNCTLIGNGTSAKRAVIFGEGAGDAISDVVASITDCTFIDWSYGVSDNQSGKDAKSVAITDCTFTNASVLISAYESATFTGNEMDNSWANITSYTAADSVKVTAIGNTLEANNETEENKISAKFGADIAADPGFNIVLKDEGGDKYYEVTFDIPEGAAITNVSGNVKLVEGVYYLADGEYTVTVSKSGYYDATKKFTVSGAAQTVSVELVQISNSYRITVAETENGTVTLSRTRASRNSLITITATPDAGYKVAKVEVTNFRGEEVAVTDVGNGTYTFRMPGSTTSVSVSFECDGSTACSTSHLTDVDHSLWYHIAIDYAVSNGLMVGTGENQFAPEVTMDRSMVIQVLYNMEGTPSVKYTGKFGDVADGKWYTNAIEWGVKNGILVGYDAEFDPTGAISREEIVRMMYNYAQYKGKDTSARGDLSRYTDGATTSDWAVEYVEWAVGSGVMVGGSTILNPTGSANRAEVAQIFKNFHEIYG